MVRMITKLALKSSGEDLTVPTHSINQLLTKLMSSEANFLGRIALPFGLSLVAVVRKCSRFKMYASWSRCLTQAKAVSHSRWRF